LILNKDTSKDDVVFEYVDVNELKEDPTNPNIMSRDQMDAVKENIKQFGFLVPIVINDNNQVADGDHRRIIAKEMGIKTVPCIRSSRLNDDIARRIARQALNKVRGEHDISKDISEIQKIIESQYKGAAIILQKVSLIGINQYQDMKRIIATGGIPNIGGQFQTEQDEEGRYYDKIQTSRKAETYLTNQIKQVVLYFTAEQYPIIINNLEKILAEMKVDNYTEVFVKLLEHYDACSNR